MRCLVCTSHDRGGSQERPSTPKTSRPPDATMIVILLPGSFVVRFDRLISLIICLNVGAYQRQACHDLRMSCAANICNAWWASPRTRNQPWSLDPRRWRRRSRCVMAIQRSSAGAQNVRYIRFGYAPVLHEVYPGGGSLLAANCRVFIVAPPNQGIVPQFSQGDGHEVNFGRRRLLTPRSAFRCLGYVVRIIDGKSV